MRAAPTGSGLPAAHFTIPVKCAVVPPNPRLHQSLAPVSLKRVMRHSVHVLLTAWQAKVSL